MATKPPKHSDLIAITKIRGVNIIVLESDQPHTQRIEESPHTARSDCIHIHHHLIVLLWPAFHSAAISRPNDDYKKHFTEYDIVAKSYYDSITIP